MFKLKCCMRGCYSQQKVLVSLHKTSDTLSHGHWKSIFTTLKSAVVGFLPAPPPLPTPPSLLRPSASVDGLSYRIALVIYLKYIFKM